MRKIYFIFLLSISILNGCIKNDISIKNTPIVNIPFDNAKKITTTVVGVVVGQDGMPLENVEISIGTSTTFTDAEGNFIIAKATLSENAGFIKATQTGYFTGSRTILPKENVVNNVFIQLIKKNKSGSFNNATGGTITVSTGGSIVFPSNALVTKSGSSYSGNVNVSAYYLDPSSENCYKEMPGDLRGINASNDEQVLTSYGMMAVEINGTNGEELQLANGKNANITFPISAATQATAPASIPLWFFDETKGMWVEQGTAIKTGNTYVGSVSHFTWWNCDWGGGPIKFTGTFIDQYGNPLSNYLVYYVTSSGWGGGGGSGLTQSTGSLTGNIPLNKSIIIKVMSKCSNTVIFTTTVGPFTQNTNGGNFIVNLPTNYTITIKGTAVDCSNNAVANGYAVIKYKNKYYYTHILNGNFSTTIFSCNTSFAGVATIDVFDLQTLKKNLIPITVNITNSGTYNVGQLAACGLQVGVRYVANFVNQTGAGLTQYYVSFTGDTTIKIFPTSSTLNTIVQANKALIRKVYVQNSCGTYVLADSTIIGPFTADFNAGIITITAPPTNTITISGTATDCSNLPISNGTVTILLDGKTFTGNVTNGTYSVSVTRCNTSANTASIYVKNNANQQQNVTPISVLVTNANVTAGNVQACGGNTTEFLTYSIKGATYNYTDSLEAARVTTLGGTSNFVTTITRNVYNPSSNFNMTINGTSIGTYSTNNSGSSVGLTIQGNYYYSNTTNNVYINVSEYGTVGQYVAGTFSGTLADSLSPIQGSSISGSFRVKRKS